MFLSADQKQIFDPRFAQFRSKRNVKSEIGSVTLVADEGRMLSAVLRDILLAFCPFLKLQAQSFDSNFVGKPT